ncbi:unnamed protein product (macronuclear) [Paramecium tetraurelia]|uniref:Mitochondrial import inner membrane translocase subunit TIM50 n=1 Tax=Paramecium tetraurelia TaxID=5888 RepID=A0CG19_PARTE|nr:uncharacterized protein GSPATT00038179001 [Paramecium tetraurelia]CAK69736.1 unnamed protein product [Paramecium tetraurelia]|eukprot:XP_001437133.1 hypothetical protein (macronuclear) [Paramecium tetraurelia strain d4-2]
MIKILRSLRQINHKQSYGLFGWFNKKEEKVDDSAYDPATWKQLQPAFNKVKEENQNKPKLLPIKKKQYSDKLTVVMELDEVLVYSFVPDPKDMFMNAPLRQYDFYIDLPEFDNFVHVYKREQLDEFLEYFLNHTEPVIWSRGQRIYVERVLEKLCPQFPKDHIFCQEQCNLVEEDDLEDYFKDLDLLGRDRKKVVYVDSKPLSFWTTGDNSIPVRMFLADNTDTKDDLQRLMNILERLKQENDVRDYLKKIYKVEETLRETKFIE